jgi:2-oxoglutarate ferredoxin oxidoreductase subunit beta
MVFGTDLARGVRRNAQGSLEVCDATDPGVLIHDPSIDDPTTAFALSRLTGVTPIGVFRDIDRPSYDELMSEQLATAKAQQGEGDLMALLHSGDTWSMD